MQRETVIEPRHVHFESAMAGGHKPGMKTRVDVSRSDCAVSELRLS
jgi:hypothetical protein